MSTLRTWSVCLVMAGCAAAPNATVCEPPKNPGTAPAMACSAEYAGVEYCTAPVSGTFFSCVSGASCWSQVSDGPCAPPGMVDGGAVSCPSGQSWKGRDCAGTDAGVRSCFGRTLATCASGCWYPTGVCLADGGTP